MKKSSGDFIPVYKHSLAVSDLGQAVASYFSPDSNPSLLKKTSGLRTEIAFSLFNDSLLIPKTIDEVARSNSKEFHHRQFYFINCIIKNLLSYCNGLEHDGVKEKEYIHLFREEVRSFKKSFKSWRKSLYSN